MTTLSPPPGFGTPRQLTPSQPPRQQSPPQSRQQSPPQPQAEKPKRSVNRRVSWANGENLFQIRLFVAEEAPGLSGSGAQDQLQAKPTRNLHIFNPSVPAPASDAPPGFGGVLVKSQSDHIAAAAIVPQISWRPPSTVVLDPTWHVMAGGASLETGLQKQRELRILEAVYPRPSSIPESPGEPLEAQEPYDDTKTPQIPLVPLEEEDTQDGSDPSNLSLGPRFPSLGPSGQGVGIQTMTISNGRQEKMKQYNSGNNHLPVPMPDIPNARKDPVWGNGTVGSAARLVDHSSNTMSGRPPPAGPLTDHHHHVPTNSSKQPNGVVVHQPNGVAQPDVAAATAAAFAALSQSQQLGSMIDNELLIHFLSDPSLIHSLQAKLPFAIPPPNSKPELSSSMNLNGVLPRGPDSMNLNGVSRGPPSMNLSGVSRGPDSMKLNGVSRGLDGMNLNGLSRGPDPSMNLNGLSRGPDPSMNLNGLSRRPDPSMNLNGLSRGPDPSMNLNGVSSKASVNGIMPPPSFASKSASSKLGAQAGVAPPLGSTSTRTLSQVDEQYFKRLIMQHGSAATGAADPGGQRAVTDNGINGARPAGNIYNTPDVKRWFGREQLDAAAGRPERSGRDRQQENERAGGAVPGLEKPPPGRAKSRKVCIYFGTPRGCRNGDNCSFVHEPNEAADKRTDRTRSAPSTTAVPYAKRLKVDG